MVTQITDPEIIQRGFTTEEFIQRTDHLQQQMLAQDVDIVLFTTEPEVRYYSGFFTQFWQSPTRPWFLLLAQTGAPVAVIPSIGETLMSQTWVQDIRCWSAPAETDDGVSLLTDTIIELAGNRARLGLLQGRESCLRMPLADYKRLCANLADYSIVDVTDMVQAQRQVKSAAEILKISAACQAAGRAFAGLPQWARTGMTERSLFQRFKLKCMDHGVDDVSFLVGAACAAGYDDIIAPPGEHKIADGDILILDTGCVVDGYFCDFDRNFAFSRVDQQTADAYRITHESVDAALALARPGVTCADLFHAMQKVLDPRTESASSSVGRMGHGLGMQLTESPSITAYDQTVMQPGMVMTLEPGLAYGDGRMMVHEENIVICEHGARLLTQRAEPEIVVI